MIRSRYGADGTLVFFDDVTAQDVFKIDGPNGAIDVPSGAKSKIAGADVTSSVSGAAVAGVASGYKVARGETALDGSNPTPVVTGLTTVVGFSATLKGSVAPGLGTSVLTQVISSGTVNVYAWKPTGATDPTLIASTGTESFDWVAIGT
jgi:hypothetical protein